MNKIIKFFKDNKLVKLIRNKEFMRICLSVIFGILIAFGLREAKNTDKEIELILENCHAYIDDNVSTEGDLAKCIKNIKDTFSKENKKVINDR